MKVHFVFVGEGSSDSALVSHLEALCVEKGAIEASGVAPDLARLPNPPGKSVTDQVTAALSLEPNANLVFVHRDSDSRDSALRYDEMAKALRDLDRPYVGVVPVQETEAWLLIDEAAIRRVAMNPEGVTPLDLPKAGDVESVSSPKERLQNALLVAADLRGRRRERFKRDFPTHRRQLLEMLNRGGAIGELRAWRRLLSDLAKVLLAAASHVPPRAPFRTGNGS